MGTESFGLRAYDPARRDPIAMPWEYIAEHPAPYQVADIRAGIEAAYRVGGWVAVAVLRIWVAEVILGRRPYIPLV